MFDVTRLLYDLFGEFRASIYGDKAGLDTGALREDVVVNDG